MDHDSELGIPILDILEIEVLMFSQYPGNLGNSPNIFICRGSNGLGITGLGSSAAPAAMVADHFAL